MLILKMSKDKNLTITKLGNTYQDENKAESIRILLPRTIKNNDLTECIVHLCVINQENVGDEINISSILQEHNENIYFADIDITNKLTYKDGKIELWIKVINSDGGMVAKTNIITYQIKKHKDIEGYIPEQQLSLLDDFSFRMENAVDSVKYAITKTPFIGDNGNWFVWDVDSKDYVDSGVSTTGHVPEEYIKDYIDEQTSVIKSDLEGIQEDIQNEAHFRGYLSTNAKIQAINATPNDFAYSAESGTKWIYDAVNGWENTGSPVPDQLTPASDTTPLVNGEASVGEQQAYARGDHRHPTDTSRTSAKDFNEFKEEVNNKFSELENSGGGSGGGSSEWELISSGELTEEVSSLKLDGFDCSKISLKLVVVATETNQSESALQLRTNTNTATNGGSNTTGMTRVFRKQSSADVTANVEIEATPNTIIGNIFCSSGSKEIYTNAKQSNSITGLYLTPVTSGCVYGVGSTYELWGVRN